MRTTGAGLAAVILFSGAASAGDMPADPYMPDPNLQPAYDWTGGYIGLHGGYGWGDAAATAQFASRPAGIWPAQNWGAAGRA